MKVAATLQITAKGQPVLYYGEEIGQGGANNWPLQTNRRDFDWTELEKQKADSNSIYNHYKTMLAIRNAYTLSLIHILAKMITVIPMWRSISLHSICCLLYTSTSGRSRYGMQ